MRPTRPNNERPRSAPRTHGAPGPTTKSTFADDSWLYEFADLFLVHCPRCDKCAQVIMKESVDLSALSASRKYAAVFYGERRLVCANCGYVEESQDNKVAVSLTSDWFFQRPLWLLTPCCGQTLSAFNERHLDFLERFVHAKLRQQPRSNTHALANTLPRWIQESRNRPDVVKCIEKLRKTIPVVSEARNVKRET